MRAKTGCWTTALLIVIALLACEGAASAQAGPGSVDTSFGGGFVTALWPTSQAQAMVVDSAGRVIAVSRSSEGGNSTYCWAVVRFTPAGAIDTTFGPSQSGQVVLFGGASVNWPFDVTTQMVDDEERIVIVGLTGNPYDHDVTLVRLKPNGTLDTGFGTNGIVQHRYESTGSGAVAVAIQADGKIVVGGFSFNKQHYAAFAIARYNIDGSLDKQTFGPPDKKGKRPGFVLDKITGRTHDAIHQGALVIQADGKILVGGYTGETGAFHYYPNYGWTLARYNIDGAIDTAFGSNGKVTEALLTGFTYFQVTGVGLQSNGKIIATGRAWNDYPNYGTDIVALRYSSAGARDANFGVSGLARTGLPDLNMRWNRQGIQSDDKIVIGAKQGDSDPDLFVFRFNADGTPDTSFGTSGRSDLIGNYAGSIEWASSLAIGPGGGIFVGGGTGHPVMAVAKFHGQVPVTTPPLAPTGLTASAASSSRIDLGWTDNASTEAGFKIERSPNGVNLWLQVATVSADVVAYADAGLDPETTYYYRVRAYNVAGDSSYSNTASDTTEASVAVDHHAVSDIAVKGTVSGTFAATVSDNADYQTITEVVYEHRLLKKRYNYLEHRWAFNVTSGSSHVFHLQAHRTASTDGDSFVFAYSVDGVNFTDMVTVTKTADDGQYQTFVLPGNLSGTVWVRVTDTDRTKEIMAPLDTISVDHMFIRSE